MYCKGCYPPKCTLYVDTRNTSSIPVHGLFAALAYRSRDVISKVRCCEYRCLQQVEYLRHDDTTLRDAMSRYYVICITWMTHCVTCCRQVSNLAQLITATTTVTTPRAAQLFYKHCYVLYGLPVPCTDNISLSYVECESLLPRYPMSMCNSVSLAIVGCFTKTFPKAF